MIATKVLVVAVKPFNTPGTTLSLPLVNNGFAIEIQAGVDAVSPGVVGDNDHYLASMNAVIFEVAFTRKE